MRRSNLAPGSGFSSERIAAQKTCTGCGGPFFPVRPLQRCCNNPVCARKAVNAKKKQERETVKSRKAALQTIPDLIKLADRAFAAFIRARDRQAGHPCISSGRPLDWTGNAVDAGHYRSRGAASALRYRESNCHAQSKHDNQYKAGNVVEYRSNLIKRIGLEAVEALEADNAVHKWTADELRQIAATYKTKLKELEKNK